MKVRIGLLGVVGGTAALATRLWWPHRELEAMFWRHPAGLLGGLLWVLSLAACAEETGAGGAACEPDSSPCSAGGRDVGRGRDGAAGAPDTDGGGDAAATDTADDLAPADAAGPEVDPSRAGGLVPEPEAIFLSAAGVGSVQEQIVRVWNQSDQTVVIHSAAIESDAAGFSLREAPSEASREPGQAVGFALHYEAQTVEDVTATIVVENSLGAALLIPVTVATKVEESGCIRVSPTSLDFGSVVRGSPSVTRTFQVQNCGTADIRVLRLDRGRVLFVVPTPESFQWSTVGLPLTLPAGDTHDVEVTYTAGRAGIEQGAVEVVSNVSGSELTRVSLRAESEVPPIADLDVHLVLTWDVDGGSDVDFHFLPESSALFSCDDCYYSNMSPDWGVAGDIVDDPFLDYDDLEGPGPENINVSRLGAGTYLIAVHYYSDTGSGGGGGGGGPVPANATVEVYFGGVRAATYGPQLLDHTDRVWNVARLEWPSRTLTPLGDTLVIDRGDYTWCRAF